MALKALFALVVVASAQAATYLDSDIFRHQMYYPSIQIPRQPTPPRLPYQTFQPYTPFNPFQLFQPFAPFPPSAIRVPSPAEIAAMNPGPNSNFNGMSMQSNSYYTRDKDGNLVKEGGTTVVINDNGKVHTMKVGKTPPGGNENIPLFTVQIPELVFPEIPYIVEVEMPEIIMPEMPEIIIPEMPEIIMPEMPEILMPQMPEIIIPEMPEMPKIVMPQMPKILPIEPIDFDKIRQEQGKDNETMNVVSTSTYSNFSSDNGNVTGSTRVIVNNNGTVTERVIEFGKPNNTTETGDVNAKKDKKTVEKPKKGENVKNNSGVKSKTADKKDSNPSDKTTEKPKPPGEVKPIEDSKTNKNTTVAGNTTEAGKPGKNDKKKPN